MSMDSLDAMRSEAMEKADQLDSMKDEMLTEMAPQGDFSMSALNKLVDALNAVLPAFGPMAEEYPSFSADEDMLPPEFVNQLMMVATAATDADMDSILSAADIEAIEDDRDLQLLAGKLRTLADSRDFKQFLKQPSAEPAMEVEEVEETEIEEPMEGGEMEVDEEALMMQRM